MIDADGLNAHAGRLADLRERRHPTVLTPHAGELGRLLERSSDQIGERRLAAAKEAARESGAVVVLKGDDTIVTDAERAAVNALSAPALATAGTGDVLSGTIGALLARGWSRSRRLRGGARRSPGGAPRDAADRQRRVGHRHRRDRRAPLGLPSRHRRRLT